jgi:hypothetical protein
MPALSISSISTVLRFVVAQRMMPM